MRRAVFLDRDGVLNKPIVRDGKPYPPRSLEEVSIPPGTKEALERLRAAGFLNVVVTNQPDVGAGKQPRQVVDAINEHLRATLPIDGIKVCYHIEADDCSCRKPKPGMLVEAARELGIDLGRSSLVGDRWRDVAAAQEAGCRAYFIDYAYSEKRPSPPYITVGSLSEAAGLILRSK
jgi:D-glycero-D-manno-heptose 1,7-bisphosphate phosphatase